MRIRLTLLVMGTTVLVLLAFLIPLAMLIRTVAQDRAVVAATADVQGVAPLVGTTDRDGLARALVALPRPVTVFLPDGSVLGAPARRTPAVELAARGESLTAISGRDREIVVAVQGLPGGTAVVRTLVPEAELTRGVHRAWQVLIALAVTLLLLGLLVADRLARALVAPIADLSAVSHRLAGADLSARARPAGPPELREVARALNHLADRIQELLMQEREEVADLSHRLRTPLTALRLEADALPEPAERARITAGVDALERAVTGLIRQARSRSGEAGEGERRCDAAEVVRDRLAFWSVLADDTDRTVHVDLADGPLPVAVSAEDLATVLDALLGNVFAHTADGVDFAVRLAARPGGGAVLTVADEGAGLGPDADPLGRGVSGAGSTGLGLDIARRAAQAGGGGLRLEPGPQGGLQVTAEFAAPPPRPHPTPL